MATIALVSAKGAPGVTTTALALTLTWPRHALLAECDPSAGNAILAGYGQHLSEVSQGLIGLALAERHGQWSEASVWSQTMPLTENHHLLPGLSDATQAASLNPLWSRLATAFTALERGGVDVIIDAGRLGTTHAPLPLLRQADVVLLLTRSNLPAIAGAHARLNSLRADLTEHGTGPEGLALLVVGEGQPYSAREISASLHVPVAATVAWDPLAADVYAVGAAPHRRHENSSLLRSVRAGHDPLQQLLTQRAQQLRPTATRQAVTNPRANASANPTEAPPARRPRPGETSRSQVEDARA
ncbi:hypothetical protein [Kineococcus sp. SYSU DK003]|uniref:hypothetical protein n=1 Tax=Kineococcus sp. SYSU DK003 TaxID=3383124 RepID=UPI003D7DAA74